MCRLPDRKSDEDKWRQTSDFTAKFDTNRVNLENNLALQVHRRVRSSGRKSNAVACPPINVLLRQTGISVTIYLATQYAPGPAAGSGAYWNLELL